MDSYPPSRSASRNPFRTNGVALGINVNTSRPQSTDYEATPVGPEAHAAIHIGRCALITGGASGIGLAAAKQFAR